MSAKAMEMDTRSMRCERNLFASKYVRSHTWCMNKTLTQIILCSLLLVSTAVKADEEEQDFSVWDIPGASVVAVPLTMVAIPVVMVGTVVVYGAAKTANVVLSPLGYEITYGGKPLDSD